MANEIQITEIEGEPRIHDEVLAKKLGYPENRLRKIRELIERNLEELQRYGSCPTVGHRKSGNSSDHYYLNEGQACVICARSDAEKAPDAREEIIRGFMAYRHD